jgi:two-component system cell cycle sensor histidine kinase/response regulator CckA
MAATSPLPARPIAGWLEWRGSGRVLIVEDDPAVRMLVARTLPRLGFTASTAANGTEALALMRKLPDDYVLILSDLRIPGMDVGDMIREIRQMRPDIAVIMMTGYNRERVAERVGDVHISGFVHKPFTLDVLASEIRSVLSP